MDYDRINYILSPQELRDKRVLIVGVGSGGAPIVQHLTMNGIRQWTLFDPDTFDEVNLVKHPARRKELGQLKVHIMSEWITDRNPSANVRDYPVDIMESPDFEMEVEQADLVVSASDSFAVRQYVNRVCVNKSTGCVTANVFRTGVGGEIYSYIPEETGCFQCLCLVSAKQGWNDIENSIEITDGEKEKIYGLNQEEYKASGLSMDIAIISAIAAKRALRLLLENPNPRFYPQNKANYVIFYLRKTGDNPGLSSQRYFISQQEDCFCGAN
jgi:molybdopterin/thiamine biosynthesis adenylyltransferase